MGQKRQNRPRGKQRKASHADEKPPTIVGFVSLGCAKNLVDSEKILGELAEAGCIITGDESQASVMVVNTCGFLAASRDEALGIITELAERKKTGSLKRIVVAGCLPQRDGVSLFERVPEIDAIVGVNNRRDVVRAVLGLDKDAEAGRYLSEYHPQPWSDQGRLRLTPAHYSYVRMSEGCNQKCTFCTIPSIRGPLHSKTTDQIVAECRELIDDGTRELLLIGQDTTSYGVDIGYEPGLAGLLRTLDRECDGARWLRLMYVYPSVFTDAMIDAIAECERVVKYIDIPLQHINDRVLKRIGRRVTRQQTETLLAKLRDCIPGVSIRTTFIVGFPGETDAEFDELDQFVREFGFDAAGAFQYSNEPETPAAQLDGLLDTKLVAERYERLMLTQQENAFEKAKSCVGRDLEVVVDGCDADGVVIGRHAQQAPEVDPVCIIADGIGEPGDIVTGKCVGSDGYDLVIEPTNR